MILNKWMGLLLITCCSISFLSAQQAVNTTLIRTANDYPQVGYNDIWGYVDDSGREYAILGVRSGTAIYDLVDPANPQLVEFVPGATSVWRDMKSYGDYIYVTTDQGNDGLTVIDMSNAPDSVSFTRYKSFEINSTPVTLSTCHNIYIDEKGYGYLLVRRPP